MVSDDSVPIELVFELPELLEGPVKLPNGQIVNIGDTIEHKTLGIGRVLRFSTYHDELGILLFVEFANDRHELIGQTFVRKITAETGDSNDEGSSSAT